MIENSEIEKEPKIHLEKKYRDYSKIFGFAAIFCFVVVLTSNYAAASAANTIKDFFQEVWEILKGFVIGIAGVVFGIAICGYAWKQEGPAKGLGTVVGACIMFASSFILPDPIGSEVRDLFGI